jgi:hypothetical protein
MSIVNREHRSTGRHYCRSYMRTTARIIDCTCISRTSAGRSYCRSYENRKDIANINRGHLRARRSVVCWLSSEDSKDIDCKVKITAQRTVDIGCKSRTSVGSVSICL